MEKTHIGIFNDSLDDDKEIKERLDLLKKSIKGESTYKGYSIG